ncbi:MAG TPA: branched-chain amino acid ABC transporter permease [Candidatus Competibacteraceae bacterium]|nr:branched-chain amino acid ABC transporter permease [Candidatus Competibacteraceae bacterium]HQA26224.1 branched-chain amino acid ABC transporter permease [Candidatus Competibacteraceae bacterium]HQD56794.1 branched-chain amino acid ABC transporter permease [Candidatus Competibacteraceae bacterium]
MRLAGFYGFAALVVLLPLLFPNDYFVIVVGASAGLHAILAVGLNLLVGYAGQISLGHAAFFGMGAYASAILTTRFGWPGLLALLAGLLVAGLLAWLLARPILRLRGHYLAMATLGFGVIVHVILVQATDWTGGPDGLSGIPPLNLFGWTVEGDLQWYGVIAAAMLLAIWLSLNLVDSQIGRALRAVHGSEFAAQMMGIDTASAKTRVFVVSALFAAFAGSLFAHQQAFVSPDSFNLAVSVELVTMVVLGGIASTFGAACGAIALTLLRQGLVVFEDYEMLIHGALLMAVMIFLPQGLFVGLGQALRTGLRRCGLGRRRDRHRSLSTAGVQDPGSPP